MNTKFSFFRLILFAVIFMQATIIQAQEEYQMQIDNIFEIPAHKVTTGVLINRSPDIIEMHNFKLQADVNNATAINTRNWLELFYRLYASHLDTNSFSYDIALANKYPGETADGQIPLGLIFYHYDRIKNNYGININL